MRGPCLLVTSPVQLSNEHIELTWTVPSKHLQRTLFALIYAIYSLFGGMGGILRQQQLGLLENIGMSSYIYTEFIARARTYNMRVSQKNVREQHL